MKKQKIVVGDIDGCLANFEGEFCEAFGSANRHLYDLTKRYPQTDPELILEWIKDEENYRHLTPIFGGITLLHQLISRGYLVYLLTARPKNLTKITTEWLYRYNVPYSHLSVGVKNKAEMIEDLSKMFDVEMVIDDSKDILESVKHIVPISLAWAQPWNAGYYPRAIYDQENMKIRVNMGDNHWKWIWSKK